MIQVWMSRDPVPSGFKFMPAVQAVAMMDEIDFVSMSWDVGDPHVDGMTVLRVLANAPTWAKHGMAIHERDPQLRAQLVKEMLRLFSDAPISLYESPDGGASWVVHQDKDNPFAYID